MTLAGGCYASGGVSRRSSRLPAQLAAQFAPVGDAERQYQRGEHQPRRRRSARPARRAASPPAPASAGASSMAQPPQHRRHAERRRARSAACCAAPAGRAGNGRAGAAAPAGPAPASSPSPVSASATPTCPRPASGRSSAPGSATIAATATLTGVAVLRCAKKPGASTLTSTKAGSPSHRPRAPPRSPPSRPGRTRRAANSTDRIGCASTISPAAAGRVSSSASSTPRFCVAAAPAASPVRTCRDKRRQDRGADRDADHPERQLVQPVGIVEIRHRAARQQRGERGRDQQVELRHPGAEHARPHDPQGLPHPRRQARQAQPQPYPGMGARRHQPEELRHSGGGQRPGQHLPVVPAEMVHQQQRRRSGTGSTGSASPPARRSGRPCSADPPCNAVSEMNSR